MPSWRTEITASKRLYYLISNLFKKTRAKILYCPPLQKNLYVLNSVGPNQSSRFNRTELDCEAAFTPIMGWE